MALANHETLFNIGVDAAFSETSLHKVPIEAIPLRPADQTQRVAEFVNCYMYQNSIFFCAIGGLSSNFFSVPIVGPCEPTLTKRELSV